MNAVKRVEIIIDAAHAPELLKALQEAGARAYTLISDVQGSGDRGERSGDELTNVFRNCYVLVACPSEDLQSITDSVRPLLARHGGMCLVSDAQWLRH